jgi:hypothetical protein
MPKFKKSPVIAETRSPYIFYTSSGRSTSALLHKTQNIIKILLEQNNDTQNRTYYYNKIMKFSNNYIASYEIL